MRDLTAPEARTERDALADHAEVLEKVGALMLLPGDTYATADLVAGYYQVTPDALRQVVVRNRDELDADGLRVLSRSEFESDIASLSTLDPHARSISVFPRRAILRVGMLLRDSAVAKAVRTALLDAERAERPIVDVAAVDRRMLAQMVIAEVDRADAAEARLIEAAPAIEYVERYVSNEDVITIKVWGAQFGLTEPQAFDLLRGKGVIYRHSLGRRWSNTRREMVEEFEHRARAGRDSFAWFDLRPQNKAPRHHNGQLRQTLYVRQAYALALGACAGLTPLLTAVSA